VRNKEIFKGKKITIVGLARSGLACANLLYKIGAQVSVTDNEQNAATKKLVSQLASKDIQVELGKHSKDFFQGRDFIIVSPGVPAGSMPFVWAKEFGVPVISEIEAAWFLCPGKVIAVTGSGGKTTVTTLIGKVIEASGRKAFVCGNVGRAFSGEIEKIEPVDFVSLEVSSFQLENIRHFKPLVAVMLNLSRNHLDRHADMQEYLEAKERIFMNQDENDFLIFNENDPVLKESAKTAKSKVLFFGNSSDFDPNQQAVLAVAQVLGIDKECCLKVFREFSGLQHRMEYVAEINGVKFINDSKATLAESTIWAINNIKSPIMLIAGGKDKGVDYSLISPSADGKVKAIFVIGEAKDKIEQALKKCFPVKKALTLEEAVRKAFIQARPGDCVLLSPMCSSFDMFANYEERGKTFKQIVQNLAADYKLSSIK